jgi:hypothetical protein
MIIKMIRPDCIVISGNSPAFDEINIGGDPANSDVYADLP